MILIKNANLLSMEEVNYEVCDILIDGKIIVKIGKIDEKDYGNLKHNLGMDNFNMWWNIFICNSFGCNLWVLKGSI